MKKITTRIVGTIDHINVWLISIIFSMLLITICWQVVSRYLLATPSTETDEISRILFIWLGLLSAAYATGKQRHIAIDLLPQMVRSEFRKYFHIACHCLTTLFACVILIGGGIALVTNVSEMKQLTPALELPATIIYLSLPASGLIMVIYSVHHLLNACTESTE